MAGPMSSATLPPQFSRHTPVRAVVESILKSGSMSRARMARDTGLSKQTISDAVRELEAKGWLVARGRSKGGLGRSAVNYEMRRSAAFVFGCDLGGSRIRVALADLSGTIVAEAADETEQSSAEALIRQISRLKTRVIAEAGAEQRRVYRAAVGMPGVVDPKSGLLSLCPNIPHLQATDVVTQMRGGFGCEVAIENDVNLGVLGEHWLGRGQGKSDLAFAALGTGIGLGLISGGRLLRGAHGAAAEIAYLPLGGDPFDPRNIESGTLESYVGTAGILRRYVEARGSDRVRGAKAIFEAMAKGEATAARVIEDTARLTALALASVAALLDPELLILSGGIGSRPEFVALVERFLAECLPRPVPVVASALENRATLIGAIAMGLSGLYEGVFGARLLPDAAAHFRSKKSEARKGPPAQHLKGRAA